MRPFFTSIGRFEIKCSNSIIKVKLLLLKNNTHLFFFQIFIRAVKKAFKVKLNLKNIFKKRFPSNLTLTRSRFSSKAIKKIAAFLIFCTIFASCSDKKWWGIIKKFMTKSHSWKLRTLDLKCELRACQVLI